MQRLQVVRRLETRQPAGAEPAPGVASSIGVVVHGRNPSFDYYLRPRLLADWLPWQVLDLRAGPRPLARFLAQAGRGSYLVVCRYIDEAGLKLIEAARPSLAGLALFDDDDIAAQIADSSLPQAYRERLEKRRGRFDRRLAGLASCRWVSTPVLATRFAGETPVYCLPPLPLAGARRAPPRLPEALEQAPLRWGYHATASHREDALWLRPIVAAVQAARPQWLFELVGDDATAEAYRGMPRVRVLRPRSWPAYLSWTRRRHSTLGLLPFGGGAVNRSRSETKLFDYARLGAVTLADGRWPWRSRLERDDAALWVAGGASDWIERLLRLTTPEILATWYAQQAWSRQRTASAAPLPLV